MQKGLKMVLSDDDISSSDDELNEVDNSFESVGSHDMDLHNTSFEFDTPFSHTPHHLFNPNHFQTTPYDTPPALFDTSQQLTTPLHRTPPLTPLHTPLPTPLTHSEQSQYFSPFENTNVNNYSPITSTPFSSSHYFSSTPFTQNLPHQIEHCTPMPTPDFSQLDSGFLPRRFDRVTSDLQIPDTPMKKTSVKSRLTPHNQLQHPSTPLHTPDNFSIRTPHLSDLEVQNYEKNFRDFISIGKGSFSEVFRALCIKDNKYYAIKVSKRPFSNSKQRDRAIKELKTVKQLDHPHLLRYLFAWENSDTKTMYIQMELCEKGSLSQFLSKWVAEHHLNPSAFIREDDLWHFLTDMILGLQHIHDNQFIHLDLKPANIFIDHFDRLKIGDFGLTIRANSDDEFIEGDSRYLAPELLEPGIARFESDIFSLGATLLEMSSLIEMPQVGHPWELLRGGNIDKIDVIPAHYSEEWRTLIASMMHPVYTLRPSANAILSHPKIQRILLSRYSLRSPSFDLFHPNGADSAEFDDRNVANYDHYLRMIFSRIGVPSPSVDSQIHKTPISSSSQLFADHSLTTFFTPSSNLTLESSNNSGSFLRSFRLENESLLNSSNSLYSNESLNQSSGELSFHSFHRLSNGRYNNGDNSIHHSNFSNNNSLNSSGSSDSARHKRNLLSSFESASSSSDE